MNITLSKPLFIHELGKRSNQEDSYFIPAEAAESSAQFFMVCDGMGGHERGEVASSLVCKTMAEQVTAQLNEGKPFDDGVLNQALQQTYAELDKLTSEGKRPGTTFTFVCFHPSGVTTANIGDSRIYHLRPRERKILFQSRDHSLVFDLYLMGELSYDEMATSPQKNVITKALMPGQENHHRADIVHIADVQPGDCFLLCSDGLLEQTSNEELIGLFAKAADMEQVRQALIEVSADNSDNHTAVILQVEAVEATPDETLPDDEKSSPFNALNVRPITKSDETLQVSATTTAAPTSSAASAPTSSAAAPSSSSSASSASSGASARPQNAKPSASPRAAKGKSAPTSKAKSKKSISPMLSITLAVLLVILIAVIGVLLLRKSSSKATVPPGYSAVAAPDTPTVVTPVGSPAQEAEESPAQEPDESPMAEPEEREDVAPAPVANPAPVASPAPVANPAPVASPAPRPSTTRAQQKDNMRDRSKTGR